MAVHRLGGTVICMEKFYAEESLKVIDTYKVTHSQWVPQCCIELFHCQKILKVNIIAIVLRQ